MGKLLHTNYHNKAKQNKIFVDVKMLIVMVNITVSSNNVNYIFQKCLLIAVAISNNHNNNISILNCNTTNLFFHSLYNSVDTILIIYI